MELVKDRVGMWMAASTVVGEGSFQGGEGSRAERILAEVNSGGSFMEITTIILPCSGRKYM